MQHTEPQLKSALVRLVHMIRIEQKRREPDPRLLSELRGAARDIARRLVRSRNPSLAWRSVR